MSRSFVAEAKLDAVDMAMMTPCGDDGASEVGNGDDDDDDGGGGGFVFVVARLAAVLC